MKTAGSLYISVGLFAAVTVLASSCASLPDATPEMKRRASSFTPPAGKANVYVIRPSMLLGGLALWNVNLDSTEFGMLPTEAYLHGYVSPGIHTLRAPATGELAAKRTVFTAEVGRNYFFLIVPRYTTFIETKQITEAEGREYVKKYKLSSDTRFDLDEQARGQ
jgi:hypothetical protein